MTVYTGTADNDTLTSGAGADSLVSDNGDGIIAGSEVRLLGLFDGMVLTSGVVAG